MKFINMARQSGKTTMLINAAYTMSVPYIERKREEKDDGQA